MGRHPLRKTDRIVLYFVLAIISLYLGADPARAASPDANPVVIRYINDLGAVRSFELADALGLLKETGIRLEFKGYSHGAPESLAALAAGSADLVGVATSAVINAI